MGSEKKTALSRRAFIGLGATAATGAALAGMAGCAPKPAAEKKAATQGVSLAGTGEALHF